MPSFRLFLIIVLSFGAHSVLADEDIYEVTPNYRLDKGQSLQRSDHTLESYREITEVLKGEDFPKTVTESGWRWRSEENSNDEATIPDWLINFFEWLQIEKSTATSLASLLEALLWLLVVSLVLFLLIKYRHQIANLAQTEVKSKPVVLPSTMFGIEINEEQLPDDLSGAARSLWQQGNVREALAILLRGSIINVVSQRNVQLLDSDTERECCLKIEQLTETSVSRYMWSLVKIWQLLAYAHKQPDRDQFESLCDDYKAVFG